MSDQQAQTAKLSLEQKIARLGLAHLDRHIFLCSEQSSPKCCQLSDGQQAWQHLKTRVDQLKSTHPDLKLHRSRANCLRVCERGPIAVVYPDGVWYHSCTPEVLDLIIEQHLVKGQVVEEYRLC